MSKLTNLDSIFPRLPSDGWNSVSRMFGNVFYDLDGNRIGRGEDVPHTRLPALLDSKQVVVGDLIPASSWGASLANLLTKASWDALRLPLIEANHGVCQLCGTKSLVTDVHEIWSYEFPPDTEMAQRKEATVFGIQKLEGFLSVCHDCHMCFHLGHATQRGVLDKTLQRLAALNNWTPGVTDRYYKTVGKRWELASEINWILDFALLKHPEGGLTIKKPWHVHPEDPRILTAPNRYGPDNMTFVINVKWRFAKEGTWRPALDLAGCM